jgi:hypothetical protein
MARMLSRLLSIAAAIAMLLEVALYARATEEQHLELQQATRSRLPSSHHPPTTVPRVRHEQRRSSTRSLSGAVVADLQQPVLAATVHQKQQRSPIGFCIASGIVTDGLPGGPLALSSTHLTLSHARLVCSNEPACAGFSTHAHAARTVANDPGSPPTLRIHFFARFEEEGQRHRPHLTCNSSYISFLRSAGSCRGNGPLDGGQRDRRLTHTSGWRSRVTAVTQLSLTS